MENTIVTFTRNKLQEIKTKGCDHSWILNKQRAEKCKYLICCHSEGIKRRDAFLVALISRIRPMDNDIKGNARWAIDISKYASIDLPNMWGGWQNPVHYTNLKQLGIEPSTLEFKELQENVNSISPLTIEQAKQGLALSFAVNPEQIEILIKG